MTRGLVVAPQPLAVEAGVAALRQGGNAIDAAIATAFAQGIVDPHNCGIGGFGSMLVYMGGDGRSTMIDFHGRAGSRATPDMFAEAVEGRVLGHAERYQVRGYVNQIGYQSVVTPGTVAGLYEAWQRFGRLAWPALLEPAIRLAREGIDLPGEVARQWAERPESGHVDGLTRINATQESARIFLKDGRLLLAGERLVQPDYADTLERVAERGADAFYQGEIGDRTADDFARNGGLVTREDLSSYRVDVYEPVRGTYRGHEIVSSPPPGSGVQVIEILNILEEFDCGSLDHGEPAYVELLARAMRLSFTDRSRYLGDPKFVDVPVDLFASKEHAAELRAFLGRAHLIAQDEARVSAGQPESLDTTHVTTVDEERNCVSLTHTLGSASGVVTPGLGFTFNNCMYQYDPLPGRPNSIEPGKARVTGISPTIVFRDGRPLLVVGAPGGTRILGAIAHTILNVLDHGMTVAEAVAAPRWHWEAATIDIEPRLYHHVREALEGKGLRLRSSRYSYDPSFARAHAIMIDPAGGRLKGGADPRGGGGVAAA